MHRERLKASILDRNWGQNIIEHICEKGSVYAFSIGIAFYASLSRRVIDFAVAKQYF